MRRRVSREELRILMRNRDRWWVEHELLKAIKRSALFKQRVEELIARAEQQLLAVGPDYAPEMNDRDLLEHRDRLAEPGTYAAEKHTLQRPSRRRGVSRAAQRLGTGRQDGRGYTLTYEDVVLN